MSGVFGKEKSSSCYVFSAADSWLSLSLLLLLEPCEKRDLLLYSLRLKRLPVDRFEIMLVVLSSSAIALTLFAKLLSFPHDSCEFLESFCKVSVFSVFSTISVSVDVSFC